MKIKEIDPSEVEVLLPTTDPVKIRVAKDLISSPGMLRFLIVANPFDHVELFSLAKMNWPSISREVIDEHGDIVGRWVTIGRESTPAAATKPLRASSRSGLYRHSKTGEVLELPESVLTNSPESQIAEWIQEQGIAEIDLLMVVDPILQVTGVDLTFAAATFDENGFPAIAFSLSDAGNARFFAMTSANAPVGNRKTQLGIVLDDVLLTAPNIISAIRKEGRITGNFTQDTPARGFEKRTARGTLDFGFNHYIQSNSPTNSVGEPNISVTPCR